MRFVSIYFGLLLNNYIEIFVNSTDKCRKYILKYLFTIMLVLCYYCSWLKRSIFGKIFWSPPMHKPQDSSRWSLNYDSNLGSTTQFQHNYFPFLDTHEVVFINQSQFDLIYFTNDTFIIKCHISSCLPWNILTCLVPPQSPTEK